MKDSGYKWIGQIPDDWKVERLKGHFTFGKGLPITKADLIEEGAPVISYGQIHSKANTGVKLDDSLERFVSKDFINSNPQSLVEEGDFIFADTSEDVEGCGACVYVDKQKELFAGYHTIIARSNNKQNNKYFAYLFLTDNWRSQIREKVDGVKLFSTTQTILKQTYILLPPQDQQKKIADFLDTKCSELQSAIDNTKQTIEEYKKLKQAVITKAVTKGLEPNRKMKASGIEWIGQIPEEWEVKRIKTLFDLRSEKNYLPLSEVNLISLYTDLGVRQHSDIEATTGNKAMNADGYKKVYKDDIVVNIILCWMGAIGRSDYEGVTSPAYDVYKPKENVNSRFYHYYFRTKGFNGDCFKRGKGIMLMRWRTYADYFRDISVVAPSETEQEKIVEYLDRKCSQIDTLISQKEQFITELEKYKQSLIYEYVTGKRVLN